MYDVSADGQRFLVCAFGQAGVDRVLEILQGELRLVMGNCGTRTVADITRAYVATPDWKI